MRRPLRVLLVEDSEDDAALLVRELRRGGYDPLFERVPKTDTAWTGTWSRSWRRNRTFSTSVSPVARTARWRTWRST